MSLWSDQSDALLSMCVATFGEVVQFQRAQSALFPITAIFGHPNQEGTEVEASGITLDVRVADFVGTDDNPAPPEFLQDPTPLAGDVAFVTRGIELDMYTAYQVQVDSEGAAKVYLRLTAWRNRPGQLDTF